MLRTSLAVAVAVLHLSGCREACKNDSLIEFRSPMGTRKVVVFRRACGATTSFSTQASLLAAGERLPNEAGNVLVIDDDHGRVAVNRKEMVPIYVNFASESRLQLAYPAGARVFSQVGSRDGVAVQFDRLDKTAASGSRRYGPICTDAADCLDGQECAKWGSFAGPGPGSTCEIPCALSIACPEGLKCLRLADWGPRSSMGGVCLRRE